MSERNVFPKLANKRHLIRLSCALVHFCQFPYLLPNSFKLGKRILCSCPTECFTNLSTYRDGVIQLIQTLVGEIHRWPPDLSDEQVDFLQRADQQEPLSGVIIKSSPQMLLPVMWRKCHMVYCWGAVGINKQRKWLPVALWCVEYHLAAWWRVQCKWVGQRLPSGGRIWHLRIFYQEVMCKMSLYYRAKTCEKSLRITTDEHWYERMAWLMPDHMLQSLLLMQKTSQMNQSAKTMEVLKHKWL